MSLGAGKSRASEVEKIELVLESTRRNLESIQLDMKFKEREVLEIQDKYNDVCRQHENSCTKVQELRIKVEDLNRQVRCEIMKNEAIERDTEMIPKLKDEIEEKDRQIETLHKVIAEKSALLNASRKSAREHKDKLRSLEKQETEAHALSEELELTKNEVNTLKRLLSGKDVIVQHKCHILDQAKMVVDTLSLSSSNSDEKIRLKKIQHALNQLKQMHIQTAIIKEHERTMETAELSSLLKSRPDSIAVRQNIVVNQNHQVIADVNTKTRTGSSGKSNAVSADGSQKWSHNPRPEKAFNFNKESAKHSHVKPAVTATIKGVARSASFHGSRHFANTNTLCMPHQTTSTHNVLLERSFPLSKSQTMKKTDIPQKTVLGAFDKHTTAFNLYTTDRAKSARYHPSLDYTIGVSSGDRLNSNQKSSTKPFSYQLAGLDDTKHQTQGHSSSPIVSKMNYTHSSTDSNSEMSSHDNSGRTGDASTRQSSQKLRSTSSLSASQIDSILSDIIQNGDRVSVTVEQAPPRYGRKKPKPLIYSGIVKFKGIVDQSNNNHRVYVGVRLDTPIGESDGIYQGTRYMFTPPGQTKFFKIQDLDSVFDISSGLYVPLSKMILCHQESSHVQKEQL